MGSNQLTGLIMVIGGSFVLYTFVTGKLPAYIYAIKTNQQPVLTNSSTVSTGSQPIIGTISNLGTSIVNLFNTSSNSGGNLA